LLRIPVINVLARLIPGYAIPLLDLAFELLTLAVYGREVIVGELAPLLFDLAFDLLPISFDTVAAACPLEAIAQFLIGAFTSSAGENYSLKAL